MSQPDEVDVVVIGLGPGGEHVAASLARAGLSVVGVDRRLVGGECPYFGCVPSKMMIRAADALAEARRVPALGGSTEVTADWTPVADRIRDEATDDWDDTVAVKRLEDAGARFLRGTGRLAGPGRVVVTTDDGDVELTVRRGVVLNTGTEPAVPPIDGLADTPYWTNRDAVRLRELPTSLVVLGGGAIGCELAQAFSRFGVEVTVVEAFERILGPEEPEASAVVASALEAEGISVRAGVGVSSVRHDGAFAIGLADGTTLAAQALLVAAGRRTNLGDVGLDTVGGDPSARAIDVDERMRVAGVDGLWAIGDITGKGAFTHMSMYQANVAIRDLTGEDGPWADYRAVSRATFTDPEVGSVGMTEKQARDAGLNVGVGISKLQESSRGWLHKVGNEGVIKVVADLDRDVLVGATAVGPSGGEIIGMLVTAIHAEVPLATLRGMHFAYPTFHRAIETALGDIS
ncbi:pyruvate/2-oxoglutarate dehydrogenase complex dihydrolipoamide dehydrogenase (E3) component [Nocardioides aromaticivorans]|uniref:Pyruvate/2-oxoglutarate dehydrogenase complex dihydrolipoamide dehydrogenase (E3) component n=1 Tax=Nocardioides aromaticivorans TaxID=200618 RepID=A0A7Z0CR78_9ACTN|nr:NAD(P)/FAD-dependent oxidoreductase [Nocardioides aromaticivorans]NYI47582.1 pyruvate/2-oxoglutarate dehydrogenase complex dihydrolipoamide dehydrogenase (E3) component [Nocardioides aromaticivorans]